MYPDSTEQTTRRGLPPKYMGVVDGNHPHIFRRETRLVAVCSRVILYQAQYKIVTELLQRLLLLCPNN